jgi:hypothetical protein
MDQKYKKDAGKLRWDLLPWAAITEVVKVLNYGLEKGYDEHSWRYVDPKRYVAALYRHLTAFHGGETIDPESKLPHLAHAMCNLMFVIELSQKDNEPERDDEPYQTMRSEILE